MQRRLVLELSYLCSLCGCKWFQQFPFRVCYWQGLLPSHCQLTCLPHTYTHTSLGLLLGTEAPVMMPNGVDFSLLFYTHTHTHTHVYVHAGLRDLPATLTSILTFFTHTHTCICACRFEGPTCNIDINECVRGTDTCAANAACINTQGRSKDSLTTVFCGQIGSLPQYAAESACKCSTTLSFSVD